MIQIITAAILAILGSLVARVMIGAGLSFITYQGVSGFVDSTVSDIAAELGGLPENMSMLFQLAGFGEALDIILSTILACLSVAFAGRIVGIKFGN